MALSGTITQGFCSRAGAYRYYLQIQWSATQNVSANTSTVTAKVYLGSYGNGYNINASATKYGHLIINGTQYNFSTAGCTIASGGTKLLYTKSVTITHNSDGTKAFTLGAYFNPAVTISGSASGTVTISTRSVTLNTIPRASSISSGASWTAGFNFTINVSRASSSFTHTINIYVNGTWIKRLEGVATSVNSNFSVAENTAIFRALAQDGSKATSISVTTYNAGATLGTTTVTGTCTAPNVSTITSSVHWTTGNYNVINISRAHGSFTHKLEWKAEGVTIHTVSGIGTSYTWYPTVAETTKVEGLLFNYQNSGTTTITTYYNGVQVRTPKVYTTTVYLNQNDTTPVFNTAEFYARDINSKTTAVTGDNKIIIQKLSTVRVTIPANLGYARRSAHLTKFIISFGGVTKEISATNSATTVDLGAVNTSGTSRVSITLVDSRGYQTVGGASTTNTIVPYNGITLSPFLKRVNNFDEIVNIRVNGIIDLLKINGSNKQTVSNLAVSFRYKLSSSSSWSSQQYGKFTLSLDAFGNLSSSTYQMTIPIEESATFEFCCTDRFSTKYVTVNLAQGIPILFVDSRNHSVGVNIMPNGENRLQVDGDIWSHYYIHAGYGIETGENQWWDSSGEYGLHLNNSDIVGVNNVFFADSMSGTEGIYFPKTTASSNSRVLSDYNKLSVVNGVIYMDGEVVFSPLKRTKALLTSSGAYMNSSQSYTPSKPIYDCETGWCLIWSHYKNGVQNNNFNYWFVHKCIYPFTSAGTSTCEISCPMQAYSSICHKRLYTNGVSITGMDANTASQTSYYNYYVNGGLVLRWVVEF